MIGFLVNELMFVAVFALVLVDEDVLTDGKWCYIVFWVIGRPNTRWNLLKKRLLEVCPSYLSTTDIHHYRYEHKQPLRHDVFLLKFWCSYDRKGLLHGYLDSSQSPRVSPFPGVQIASFFTAKMFVMLQMYLRFFAS